MLETVFDEWVRDAQKKFLSSVYPQIDDAKIDMADELFACANRVVDVHTEECIPSNIEPAIKFFDGRLIDSEGALPVRFVILNFLYRLAHHPGFKSESDARDLHAVVWPHFKRFVGLRFQEVAVLEDAKAARWEITNACAIHDWDRASALYDLLKSLGAISASEHRALRGQMYLCSVVAPRGDDTESVPTDSLAWWVPKLDPAYSPFERSMGLLAWGMTLADEAEYSEWERQRLSDAAHDWEIGFQKDSEPLGWYRAAWGKCYFLLEDYRNAARQFECLLPPNEIEDGPWPKLYLNTVECYQMAGDSARATELLNQCVAAFPKEKGLWLKLAELYAVRADFEKVNQCLGQGLKNDPSFGDDPGVLVALALGEVNQGGINTALRRVAEAHPDHFQFMETIVAMHWPAFKSLDLQSKEEWVGAAHYLWGAGTNMQFRAPLRKKMAGAFADVAEGQLQKLFASFRQDRDAEAGPGRGPQVDKSAAPDKSAKLAKYLRRSGYLNLGDMIHEIEAVLRSPEPLHREFKAWLTRWRPRLIQGWSLLQPGRLNELRVRASHAGGSISEEEAGEMYLLCVRLVSALVTD